MELDSLCIAVLMCSLSGESNRHGQRGIFVFHTVMFGLVSLFVVLNRFNPLRKEGREAGMKDAFLSWDENSVVCV